MALPCSYIVVPTGSVLYFYIHNIAILLHVCMHYVFTYMYLEMVTKIYYFV